MVSLRSRVAAGLCGQGKFSLSLRFRALLGGVHGKYQQRLIYVEFVSGGVKGITTGGWEETLLGSQHTRHTLRVVVLYGESWRELARVGGSNSDDVIIPGSARFVV
jgi:hypothetical protein